MDIRFGRGGLITCQNLCPASRKAPNFGPFCSRRESQSQGPEKNGGGGGNEEGGKKSTADWDKAWSSFKKRGKRGIFSGFSPNKYVTWNPRQTNFPLSEEVDPIKRTERSNLMLWTSPRFTLGGAVVIVTFLLVYTILAPIK